mgnify:CR=1 FL=1
MIEVTKHIAIPDAELNFEFIRSGGPGGQKVNKTSSAVVLKFNVRDSPSIPVDVKARIGIVAGSSLTGDGILVIHSRKYRSQIRNRENAIQKLVKILRKAAREQRKRLATQPTTASEKRRLKRKRIRSLVKKNRSFNSSEDDFE